MIHIAFEGGLGNQLFEYVFCRHHERILNERVSYDISKYKFEANEEREFELASFNISQDWKQETLHKSRFKRFGVRYAFYLLLTFPYIHIRKHIKQDESFLDGLYQFSINKLGFYRIHYGNYRKPGHSFFRNKYFRGQWIFPKVVKEISRDILPELQVITPLTPTNKMFIQQITSCNSVGVHIRRGDYVTLGLVVCNIKYYEACIKKMNEMEKDAVFFVFSDDIPWVRENLHVDAKLAYVDNNNPSPEDMRLLYSCNHFIMSNSTFSWWGAFLGKCPNKRVMVPMYWDVNNLKKESRCILDEWIKVDNTKYL